MIDLTQQLGEFARAIRWQAEQGAAGVLVPGDEVGVCGDEPHDKRECALAFLERIDV